MISINLSNNASDKINEYKAFSIKNFEILSKTQNKSKSKYIDELVQHYMSIRDKAEINSRLKLKFDLLMVLIIISYYINIHHYSSFLNKIKNPS